jgi:dipeptidyl aminopeptidase/acylaminoacyl peptidase
MLSVSAAMATARPLDFSELLSAKRFQASGVFAAFSPDEKLIATVVVDPARIVGDPVHRGYAGTTALGAQENIGADIWVGAGDKAGWVSISSGQGNNWAPSWSPAGDRLAFISDRDGQPHLWLWTRQTRQLRKISDAPIWAFVGNDVPIWTKDGSALIALVRSRPAPSRANAPQLTAASVTISTLPLPPEKATTLSLDSQQGLASINASTGQMELLVSDSGISNVRLSPDGKWLAYTRWIKGAQYEESYALAIIELQSRKRAVLDAGFPAHGGAFVWSPDSTRIAYVTGTEPVRKIGEEYFLRSNDRHDLTGHLRIASVAKAKIAELKAPQGIGFSWHYNFAPVWSCNGRSIFLQRRSTVWRADVSGGELAQHAQLPGNEIVTLISPSCNRDLNPLFAVIANDRTGHQFITSISTRNGSVRKLFEWPGDIGSAYERPVSSSRSTRIAFLGQTAAHPTELWLFDTRTSSAIKATDLTRGLDGVATANAKIVGYTDLEGHTRRSAVLVPDSTKFEPPHPAVVWVYPGGAGSENFGTFGFSELYNLQVLASRGYAVIAPDIPVVIGAPVKSIVDQVTRAIRTIASGDAIDLDRLAVMGQSGGSNAVLTLLAHTSLFRAGIANAPAAMNPVSSFGANPLWWTLRAGGLSGAPWNVPEEYLENSPVFFLNRISAPILVQAGAQDSDSVNQSRELYEQLRFLGKQATFLTYAGEDHVLQAPVNLIDYWQRVVEFLQSVCPSQTRSSSPNARS